MGNLFSKKRWSKKKHTYTDSADLDESTIKTSLMDDENIPDEDLKDANNEYHDALDTISKDEPALNSPPVATVSQANRTSDFVQEHPCIRRSRAPTSENFAQTDEGELCEAFEGHSTNAAVRQKLKPRYLQRDSLPKEQDLADGKIELEDMEDDVNIEQDYVVEKRDMAIVAHQIGNKWKVLARELITDPEVDSIELKEHDIENRMYEAIRKWKERHPKTATMRKLACHLEAIGRKDIANEIRDELSKMQPDPTIHNGENLLNLLQKIQERLKSNYRALQMKGLPWMKDVLTLEDIYVDLVLTKVNRSGREDATHIHVEDIFNVARETSSGLRILVEGGLGSGKTTLAAKLAHDWSKSEPYISQFEIVLLVPVRQFNGNWKTILKKASLLTKKYQDGFLKIIEDKSKSVLVILDGYDEVSMESEQEILNLLKRDRYPHVSVIVTSRCGKLTSTREEAGERTVFADADVAPVFTHFLDQRVKIEGFNEQQQKMFIDIHMESFSDQQKEKVRTKLDKMVDKEFLTCPLYLFMLIVVFTSDEDVKDTETKTGLYKHVFNLLIRRYFSKTGSSSVHSIDLFSCNEIGENPPHIVLMTQFSQFALKALRRNNYTFTREEIVEKYKFDRRILELGFLKENLMVEKFREFLTYEPVHKSVLEFAAAYGIYVSDIHSNPCQFINDVTTFRPRESNASFFFPFLMGLLQENAGVLFKAIISYAFEYSCKFEYLQSSLIEIELKDSILTALTPFLPSKWKIFSSSSFENYFLISSQHKALVRWGVQQGKIRQISWDLVQDAILPTDVVVDTLVLDMQDVLNINTMLNNVRRNSQYKIWEKTHNKLHCKYLWCTFRNSFCDSSESLKKFLDCLKFVDFQQISFEFSHYCLTAGNELPHQSVPDSTSTSQQLVTLIYQYVTEGTLRNVHMYTMSDATCIHTSSMLSAAGELIKAERLQSLEMYVSNAQQKQIELFLNGAATSSYLRNLVFGTKSCCMEGEEHLLTVNLDQLCENGQKSWEWVELAGLKVDCPDKPETSFLIRHLDVSTCRVQESVMQQCHIKSLNCPASLLAYTSTCWRYQTSVTELNITVDSTMIDRDLHSITEKLNNLQILALTMAPLTELSTKLTIDQLLWNALSLLHLKGFEIWSFSKNANLAKDLVEGLVKCLEARPSGSISRKDFYKQSASSLQSQVSHTKWLQLEYLMLNDTESESSHEITQCLTQLKTCLQCKHLQRLDMVFCTQDKNHENAKMFPHEDGFRVEHDLWGSKVDDSIYSRGKHRMSLMQRDRISVKFMQQRPMSFSGSHFSQVK